MPFYTGLRAEPFTQQWRDGGFGGDAEETRRRVLEGLGRIRAWFDAAAGRSAVPRRNRDHLLLATWNLREFDSSS